MLYINLEQSTTEIQVNISISHTIYIYIYIYIFFFLFNYISYRKSSSDKLTVNSKKTKHMLVIPTHARKHEYRPTVKMGNDILENVNVYNYLGVSIDNSVI